MFRNCCFDYAGTYSGKYNLTMMYVENSYKKFDSGGKYDLVSDTMPKRSELLLYGMNYADKPLEFSVEIINDAENIPTKKMREIKNWLFGQDGWKTLRLYDDEYSDVYLKCVLVPEEDIVDGTGYRGLRCTVKGNSAFWYGRDELISVSQDNMVKRNNDRDTGVFSISVIDFPTTDKSVLPKISVLFGDIPDDENCVFSISNLDVESVDMAFDTTPALSIISFNIDKSFSNDIVTIDLEFGEIYFARNTNTKIPFRIPAKIAPLFHLKSGVNICSADYCSYIKTIKFEYIPQVRVGAF